MLTESYDDLLTWAYLGEAWGERMVGRLIQHDTFVAEDDHLHLLLALEARTRRTLEALVVEHGLQLDQRDACQEADDYADRLRRSRDWQAFMQETFEIATEALPRFETLLHLGPAPASRALTEVVEHEQAVLSYASSRLAGHRDEAAEAVSQHLDRWAGLPSVP